MEIESLHDKDQTTDEGIWREAAERLDVAITSEASNRQAGVDAKRFRWGDQWPDDVKNARRDQQRPTITVNHTNVICQRQENTLRQQRPRIKVQPVGDGADVETAKVIQGMIRHIENRSFSSVAYDNGSKGSIDIGFGYLRIRSDFVTPKSFDQEILIDPIFNPFRVYMDPLAEWPDARDQNWSFISDEMPRTEYKRLYPGESISDFSPIEGEGDSYERSLAARWENKLSVRLAEYYRRHEVKDTLIMMNDGQAIYKSELPSKLVGAALNWRPATNALTGKPIERESSRLVVQWFRINGKKVIAQKTIPGRFIPIVRVEGNVEQIEGKRLRKGMIQDLMDPARMYNYWRTAQTERYALAPKAPWVAAEGQIDDHSEWHDANQKSYSVLVYKPVVVTTTQGDVMIPPPQRQPPAPVEDGMAAASAGAEHDLMSVAGMPQENPELSARIVGGNKYLQRRQGMQDLAHYQYYDKQELAIAWAGNIILEWIPAIYDTERMQKIIREDEQPDIVPINQKTSENGIDRVKNDVTVGLYSVVMDTGPDYMTAREEAAENMIETLKTPLGPVVVEQGADVILRNMSWHGADQLADRVATTIPGAMDGIIEGLPDQAKNIIATMQQQLQKAQEVIQQQQLEIKYGTDKEHLKTQGTLEKTDRDNETRIYIESMKGSTSRDVAEIHGATQLLNTKAESAHEERSAQKIIDAGTKDRTTNGTGV
jgi:hypothetical protein